MQKIWFIVRHPPLPRTRAGQSLFATCLDSDSGAYLKARYITALHSQPLFHCTRCYASQLRSLNNRSSTGKRSFHGDFEQWNMEHEASTLHDQPIQHLSWCLSLVCLHLNPGVVWRVSQFVYLSTRGSPTWQEWANNRYAVSTGCFAQLVLHNGWWRSHLVPGYCHCHGC